MLNLSPPLTITRLNVDDHCHLRHPDLQAFQMCQFCQLCQLSQICQIDSTTHQLYRLLKLERLSSTHQIEDQAVKYCIDHCHVLMHGHAIGTLGMWGSALQATRTSQFPMEYVQSAPFACLSRLQRFGAYEDTRSRFPVPDLQGGCAKLSALV